MDLMGQTVHVMSLLHINSQHSVTAATNSSGSPPAQSTIIGAVVGSAGGLLLLALIGIVLYRHR